MPEDKEATTSTSAFVWLRVRSASLLRLRMSDTTRAIRSSTSGGNFGQMLQSRVQSIAVMIFWQDGHLQEDRCSRECLKRSGAEKCTVVYAQRHQRLAEKNGQDRLKFAVDHLVLTQCSRRHSCQLLNKGKLSVGSLVRSQGFVGPDLLLSFVDDQCHTGPFHTRLTLARGPNPQ